MATALTAGTSEPWRIAPHFALLNAELLDLAAGNTQGLIICMPPQNGKSTLISHYFLTWYLATFPDRKILFSSYEAEYASEWLVKVRDTIREHFNLFGLQLKMATRKRFSFVGRNGGMQSTGVGGPMTGKSGDLLVIDDPIKNAEQARSITYREAIDNWYRSVATTRLSPNGSVIIVVTRWNHDDLVGRIKKRMEEGGRQFKVIELPAIAVGDNDPLGRKEGEPLWPERYPLEWLKQQKIDVGPYYWAAQYQQNPSDEGMAIIKPEWWQFYRWTEDGSTLPHPRMIIQFWDTAFKDGQQNDYSVCTTWYLTDTGFYCVDMKRDRMSFPRLESECINQAAKWNPHLILVEDKASGQSLVQVIRKNTRLPIRAVPADTDKVQRLHLVSGLFEGGRVYLPQGAPYTQDILDEFKEFPNGAHDDIVDSFTGALEYLRKKIRTGPTTAQRDQSTQAPPARTPLRRESSFLKGFS